MTQELDIRPNAAYLTIAKYGALVFALSGVPLLFSGVGLPLGVLSLLFFGWIYWKLRRDDQNGAARGLLLTEEGVWLRGFVADPKIIYWSEIEALSVSGVSGQSFNLIALKDPARFAASFSEEEAARTLRLMRRLQIFAGAAAAATFRRSLSALFSKRARENARLSAAGRLQSLADVLRYMRRTYGAEIALSWNDRDRSARALNRLLGEWRDRYASSG